MSGSCPSKLDGQIILLHFGIWSKQQHKDLKDLYFFQLNKEAAKIFKKKWPSIVVSELDYQFKDHRFKITR